MRVFIAVLFVAMCLTSHIGYPQFNKPQKSDIPELKNYAIKTYNINNGLPSNGTTSAIKDRNGFLWVGTENGLCRFDGYTFKTFVNIPGDSTSLTNNYINTIVEDKKGRIWVGTLDGLNLLDPLTEKFKRFNHQDRVQGALSNNKIWSLLADKDNNIWIGTDDGFDHYIEKTKNFEVYQPNPSNINAIKGKSVNAIVEDSGDNLWLGNWSGGLNRFNKSTKKFVNFPQAQNPNDKNPNDVWSLCLDKEGDIWVGTYWKGLFKFDIKTSKFTSYPSPANENHGVFRILDLGYHLMLLAGNNNFYWFNSSNNTWQQINNFNSFQQAGLFQDRNGIIWICSMEGLTKLDGQQYKFAFYPFSNEKHIVKSILVKDHAVWVGTNNGLNIIQLSKGILTTLLHSNDPHSIGNNAINKLYLDNSGKLWDLTEFGFDEYNDQTGKFTHHSHHSSLGSFFNEDVFRDILEVTPGEYWLATDAGLKIYHSKTNTFTHYYNQKGKPYTLSNNHLYCLLKDADNNIWIGTEGGGLNRFDPSTHGFYNYVVNDKTTGSLSNNDIHDLFLDAHHNIWVCTQDGLNRYIKSSNSFRVYSKNDGFAGNVFKQMVEDSKGSLWIVTETRVSCFNPVTLQIKNFDEGDGVFSNAVIYKVNDHANVRINGQVTDEKGVSLPGVSVSLKGTSVRAVSDKDGNFSITVPNASSGTLVLSYVGYITQKVTLNGQTNIQVSLHADSKSLSEVVVVGYGTQKKATLTGSISVIKGADMVKSPEPDLSNSFAGRVSGVVANNTSGEPGYDGSNIVIRGLATYGNTSVLVVVDGVPGQIGGLERLDPNDIESVSILKDGSAAIYGSRAINGVILITTKHGKAGKPTVTYSFNQGFDSPTHLPQMADAATYVQIVNGAATVSGAGVIQWPQNGGNNQQWIITDNGNGYYKITNRNSSLVLDVNGASAVNGAGIIQSPWDSGNSKQWQLTSTSTGVYKVTNYNSGLALDVNVASTANGVGIIQWPWNSGSNQQWIIVQQ